MGLNGVRGDIFHFCFILCLAMDLQHDKTCPHACADQKGMGAAIRTPPLGKSQFITSYMFP